MLRLSLTLIETKRDERGRQIRSAEERESLLQAYRESGLTQKAFAAREGIKLWTFVSWVQAANRLPRTVPTFAEVRIASRAVSAAVEIVLPDGVVVRGGDMESVITVANRLRRC